MAKNPYAFTPGRNDGEQEYALQKIKHNLGKLANHKDRHDPEDGDDALDTAAPEELAGVQAAAVGTSHSFPRADHAHQIQHSIADNHLVTIDDADAADDDYAKFTASGLEGRSVSEVNTDLSVRAIITGRILQNRFAGITG